MFNRVIMSVDVEDWYHGPTVINPQDPARSLQSVLMRGNAVERAHLYVHTCLELFSRHQVKATFFWVAEYARRFPHLLRAVVDEGHEIACHGLWHCSKVNARTKRNTYSREEFRRITGEAKSILEDRSGQAVVGYRAPNAYVSGAMIDVLEEMGFRYDSSVSVNSLYNKTDTVLRGVSTLPYYPRRGSLEKGLEPRSIVEFPWPYWDVLGFKLQTAGGPFLRIFGWRLMCAGLRQSLRRGHTIFYFHPVDLCNEPIPIPFHWSRPFLWAIKGDLIRRRVDRILKTFAPRAANFASVLDGPLFQ
jgi:hypothetical protein